jgi:hypothetical protein
MLASTPFRATLEHPPLFEMRALPRSIHTRSLPPTEIRGRPKPSRLMANHAATGWLMKGVTETKPADHRIFGSMAGPTPNGHSLVLQLGSRPGCKTYGFGGVGGSSLFVSRFFFVFFCRNNVTYVRRWHANTHVCRDRLTTHQYPTSPAFRKSARPFCPHQMRAAAPTALLSREGRF